MLNSSPGFRCQAAYPDGKSALLGIPTSRPDVVLMDINIQHVQEPKIRPPVEKHTCAKIFRS